LLLAARRGDELVYVRSVGTGFAEKVANDLRKMLDRIKRSTPPILYTGRRKDLVWVQPTLIAEIEYRAWTGDGKLRHAHIGGCARSRTMRPSATFKAGKYGCRASQ